jgi:hypothetical protein
LSEPAAKWPDYLKMFVTEGQEKHILFNFHDAEAQKLAEERNFAGRIVDAAEGQDYLHINDANLAGLKSNFYLNQETTQEVSVAEDGTMTKKLTIVYHNTGKQDGWLNARARNYTRVYVPKGSKLVKTTGGEQKVTTTEDLGKTVFDNFVQINPLGKATLTFEYTLPFKAEGEYRLLIQKQAGAKNWTYVTKINGQEERTLVDGDKELKIGL